MAADRDQAGDQVGAPGEAARQVTQLGGRYAAGIRVVTLVPIGLVAVLAADGPAMRWSVLLAIAILAAWSTFYAVRLYRGVPTWATVADALLLCALGLATAQVTPESWLDSGKSWLRPFVTFAAVGYQYSTPWRTGLPAGAAICTIVCVAAGWNDSLAPDALFTVVWSNAISLLARLLFTLLTRAAGRADETFADAEAALRQQQVAESVRADQRAVGDALHDTAATTLLMVAIGQADQLGEVLRRRAGRDLRTLTAMRSGDGEGSVDLCKELRALGGLTALDVRLDGPEQLDVPSEVARALVDAVGEALTNVGRHAGTALAQVRFGTSGSEVFVEITDQGCGFNPDCVPATRRGLRWSITDRVAAVGGAATITSAVGVGTRVRLGWPA